MSRRELDCFQRVAMSKCHSLGLHPLHEPLGDDHHTDMPFTDEDREVASALAYFLGTLFADIDGEESRYWYYERTSINEWSRVVRALRIHGLAIKDQDASTLPSPKM